MIKNGFALWIAFWLALPATAETSAEKLFPVSLQGGSMLMVQELTREELANTPLITMTCPSGYHASTTLTTFDNDSVSETDVDWVDDWVDSVTIQSADTGRWLFRNVQSAPYQKVYVLLLCIERTVFLSDPTPYQRKSRIDLQNGQVQTNLAQCDEGEVGLGGSAFFAEGNGRILNSYPTHAPNTDPFSSSYDHGPPKAWRSVASCQSNSCIQETNVLCGKTNRYANTYPLKSGAEAAGMPKVKSEKLTIAPNSTYTLNLTCEPDRAAVAGGYFSSNPIEVALISFEPIAAGTPYQSRTPGTHDAPLGYKAKFKNYGTSSAQVGIAVTCVDSPTGRTTVTEFFNTTLNHYFITGSSTEVEGILQGAAGAGWQLTGQSFTAYLPEIGPGNDVCRFYNFVANTHFYTANPGECTWVRSSDPGWTFEGLAFRAQVPSGGSCLQGTLPVYRAYNNRHTYNDANHRLTTSLTIYNQMVASGWSGEGTVMCAVNVN